MEMVSSFRGYGTKCKVISCADGGYKTNGQMGVFYASHNVEVNGTNMCVRFGFVVLSHTVKPR